MCNEVRVCIRQYYENVEEEILNVNLFIVS